MKTYEELCEYAHKLDAEYANAIRPMLERAHKVVNALTDPILNHSFRNIRKMTYMSCFKFGKLPLNIQNALRALMYHGNVNDDDCFEEIKIPNNVVEFCGYSESEFCIGGTEAILNLPRNKGQIDQQSKTIIDIKKKFNDIRHAFGVMFVEKDGAEYAAFCDMVSLHYKEVMRRDSATDLEIDALFGTTYANYENVQIPIPDIRNM